MRAYNFGVRKPMIIRDASYQDFVDAPEIMIAEKENRLRSLSA